MERESLLYHHPQFEPSHTTRNLWLFCRRKETAAGSPGLFCSPRRWDTPLFFLILLLELIGLYFFYTYVGNLTFAIAFLVADITFALFAHIFHGPVSIAENRLFLLRRNVKLPRVRHGQHLPELARAGQIRREKWKLFRLRSFATVFYSLISMLAFFKVAGFMANWPGRDPVNSISVTICLTYVVVAYLHIYATGYFVFSSLFFLRFDLDLKKHREQQGRLYAGIDAGTATGNRYEGIDLHTLLLTDPKYDEFGYRHKSRAEMPRFSNCTVRNHFLHDNRLYLYGVLTDEDLNAFLGNHANNVEGKTVLGIVLLEIQLSRGLLGGGIDRYTEPVPFPAGNIAGPGAVEPARQPAGSYSVARVGNDHEENRRERAGQPWEYEWVLEERIPGETPGQPPVMRNLPGRILPSGDPLTVEVNFAGLDPGTVVYLSVHARNQARPFVRGIPSPPFPVRILA